MSRILPVILVVVAIGLHAAFYDWDAPSSSVPRSERTFSPFRSALLLANSPQDLDDDELYGVVLPGLLFAGALVMGYFQRDG